SGTGQRRDHQNRPHGARPHGRGEAVADKWRGAARRRRGDRDHARRGDTHFLPRCSPDTRLVGDLQRRLEQLAGTARRRAAHSAGRQRRERRRAEGGRALPADLDCGRPHRGGAGAEACRLGLQRRNIREKSMISFDDFYALAPANRCISRPTRDIWPNEAVDARLPPQPLLDAGGNPVRVKGKVKMIPASKALALYRSVERMTWAPGEPEVIEGKLLIDDGWIEKGGAQTYNTYLPPAIRLGDPARATRWLEHWYKLYPRDIAEHCIAWLAQRRQHPGIKPNHGLVLIGAPGIGKDMSLVPVRYAVGTWNFRDITLNDLVGKNNDFLCAVIV